MLLKYETADAVKGPYSLDLLEQKSLSVTPEQQRELFSYRECTFFIGERKIWKIVMWVGFSFSYWRVGSVMKLQLLRKTGQHIACFALLVSVAWCNLYKIDSHLKMLGSWWIEVLGRWCEMSSIGPAQCSLVKGGHLLGPSPMPKAQSPRKSLSYSSAGCILREMARGFQGANSWLENSVCQKQSIFADYIDFFLVIPSTQWNLKELQNCKKFWPLFKGRKCQGIN